MAPGGGSLSEVAVVFVAVYLALHAMYAGEVLATYVGVPFPIVGPLVILLAGVALTGFFNFFKTTIAIPYVALIVWIVAVSVLFSYWGYVKEMLSYGVRFHLLMPIAICAVAVRLRQVRNLILGNSVGFLMLLVLCWRYGQTSAEGRFALPNTSLENPNDLALHILFCMALMAVSGFGEGFIGRAVWLVAMLSGMYFVFKTGSRANLLTLGVMCAGAFWLFQWRQRLVLVIAGCGLALTMVVALPRATLIRLTTFQSVSAESANQEMYDHLLQSAVGSTQARKQLQMRAIKLTAENPIFGVGPRMFMYALDTYMRTQERFVKGSWQVPHNTYLDVSAETGIPGLILYVWVIAWCLRTNYRGFRALERMGFDRQNTRLAGRQTQNLFLATLVFAFGTLFCSIPYTWLFTMLVGLTGANWIALREAGVFRKPERVKTEDLQLPAAVRVPPTVPPSFANPLRAGRQSAAAEARRSSNI